METRHEESWILRRGFAVRFFTSAMTKDVEGHERVGAPQDREDERRIAEKKKKRERERERGREGERQPDRSFVACAQLSCSYTHGGDVNAA